jgi:hypothetical protein
MWNNGTACNECNASPTGICHRCELDNWNEQVRASKDPNHRPIFNKYRTPNSPAIKVELEKRAREAQEQRQRERLMEAGIDPDDKRARCPGCLKLLDGSRVNNLCRKCYDLSLAEQAEQERIKKQAELEAFEAMEAERLAELAALEAERLIAEEAKKNDTLHRFTKLLDDTSRNWRNCPKNITENTWNEIMDIDNQDMRKILIKRYTCFVDAGKINKPSN